MHKRSLFHTCAFGLMLPWARFACRLRDIFIDERRSHGHAEGPLDHQSCLAMGNSERAWTEFHDKAEGVGGTWQAGGEGGRGINHQPCAPEADPGGPRKL